MIACIGLQIILILATLLTASYSPVNYQYPSGSLACKTYNKTKLDCSNRDLVEVPTLDWNLTTSLDLSTNHMLEITGTPFEQLQKLLRLNVSRNKIAKLSETAFRGLYSLKYLYLHYNKLTDLPDNVFADLFNLVSLNLNFNQFTAIPNRAISTVHSLQTLFFFDDSANEGQIAEINLTGFQNLTALKHMKLVVTNLQADLTLNTFQPLSHSPLKTLTFYWFWTRFKYTLDEELFAALTNVTTLNTRWDALPSSKSVPPLLSDLSLSSHRVHTVIVVDKTTLQHLQKVNLSLTNLGLHLVRVKEVDDYSFIWIPNLITLDLSINSITHLSTHAFHGLQSLQKLLLHNNQLYEVPTDALGVFRKYSTLRYLDLTENKISYIPSIVFSALESSLKHLNIESNENRFFVGFMDLSEKLNHIFIKGKMSYVEIRKLFPLPSLQTFQITNAVDINFRARSLCSSFPNLEKAIIPDTEFEKFPSDLALHKCSHLFHLDLSGSVKTLPRWTRIISTSASLPWTNWKWQGTKWHQSSR